MYINFRDLFEIVFGRPEPNLKNLLTRGQDFWQGIAKPQILADGTLVFFPYDHKMVKDAIFYIKNKRSAAVVEGMCNIVCDFMLEELSERAMMEDFTSPILIAIPSSSKRILRRGFNPSEVIASVIAGSNRSFIHIPNALRKIKETKSQKTLSRGERLKNMRHTMEVATKYVDTLRARCVVVVDDITTTGATLEEAKRALISSGARKVLCIALAH